MIAHIRVPQFLSRVMAEDTDSPHPPLIVYDSARILASTPAAEELGLEAGMFLNRVDCPKQVIQKEFSLDRLEQSQRMLRKKIEGLSPVIESLELGEFLVEVDDRERFKTWFTQHHGSPFPFTAAIASTGWLARIISFRLNRGNWEWIRSDQYRESLRTVKVSEFWGMGSELVDTLQEVDLKYMAEIIHLDEPERRKLTGSSSRIFQKLLNGSDPRPLNVFSRPRVLSCELRPGEELFARGMKAIKQFRQQLQRSASLSYRLSFTLHQSGKDCEYSHEFTTPTNEVKLLGVAWRGICDAIAGGKQARISLEMIVADVENYHRHPQSDPGELEILS